MSVVRHKIHSHSETDPQNLKILHKHIFENGKHIGVAWSILGDDRGESVVECNSTITALDTAFTIHRFEDFCSILEAWHKTKTHFGGRGCVTVFPVPNASYKLYYAPGSEVPRDHPLDKMDPHYHVPRSQFETMKSEHLNTTPCAILTGGKRWFNMLGHPIGESFRWDDSDILWDRSNLLWLINFHLTQEQFQQLWNHALTVFNLEKKYRDVLSVEIDRHDAVFLLAVQIARNARNHHA